MCGLCPGSPTAHDPEEPLCVEPGPAGRSFCILVVATTAKGAAASLRQAILIRGWAERLPQGARWSAAVTAAAGCAGRRSGHRRWTPPRGRSADARRRGRRRGRSAPARRRPTPAPARRSAARAPNSAPVRSGRWRAGRPCGPGPRWIAARSEGSGRNAPSSDSSRTAGTAAISECCTLLTWSHHAAAAALACASDARTSQAGTTRSVVA